MTPAEITDAVLDMVRDDRRVDWEETEPDVVQRVEHCDIPLIEIVWDAAWNAAVDACASGGRGTAAERIAALEETVREILAVFTVGCIYGDADGPYKVSQPVPRSKFSRWQSVLDGTGEEQDG